MIQLQDPRSFFILSLGYCIILQATPLFFAIGFLPMYKNKQVGRLAYVMKNYP